MNEFGESTYDSDPPEAVITDKMLMDLALKNLETAADTLKQDYVTLQSRELYKVAVIQLRQVIAMVGSRDD